MENNETPETSEKTNGADETSGNSDEGNDPITEAKAFRKELENSRTALKEEMVKFQKMIGEQIIAGRANAGNVKKSDKEIFEEEINSAVSQVMKDYGYK